MPDELEERLKSHAQAFDSLLSLIPAKLYYGEDVSNQWQRKKQTPEQKRAAKMAKLDPDNWKSAKDVMDERQAAILKRKREEDDDLSDSPLVEPEKPKADQAPPNPKMKKRKLADSEKQPEASTDTKTQPEETENDRIQRRKEAKAAKKERKKERKLKAKEKIDRQKAKKKESKQQHKEKDSKDGNSKRSGSQKSSNSKGKDAAVSEDEDDDEIMAEAIDVNGGDAFSKGAPLSDQDSSDNASEPEADEVFSPLHDSGISSSSSINPPSHDDSTTLDTATTSSSLPLPSTDVKLAKSSTPKSDPNPPAEQSEPAVDPRQRLQAAITAFRADRKADDGPRSRAELLEQRRRQEETRRATKKEQKRREREEEARKQEEEIAKRFSPGGSGSLLGSPRSPIIDSDTNNFSFGRVAFTDGSTLDAGASSVVEQHKKKGPSDPATALKAAQAKQQRVSGLDAEKRATIHEKDMWLNARKRASGEKVKDDTSLLKKALKRHDGQKKKSEKEWGERKEGVAKSMYAKQKKRNDNLEKRKDEKGQKGKKGKVKRPGFEGSFRGRTGGGKKNA